MDIPSYLLGKKAGGGGTVNLQEKNVTVSSNGSQNITADTGYDGLSKVALTTNVQPTLQTKSVSISSNGSTTVSKDNGYDGMTEVSITTSVQPTNQSKSLTITENKTTTITPDDGYDGLSSVEVTTNVSGVVEAVEKDVNFYDYDGTRMYSYTKTEFLALSAMPNNPTHDGLTAQGWNWTLQDAQDYVTDNDVMDIGQMYVTSDGATRIYIHLEENRTSPYLGFAINGTATVDWGDGSPTEQITGTSGSIVATTVDTLHEYSSSGDYVISISSEDTIYINGYGDDAGSHLLWDKKSSIHSTNRTYQNAIKKVELGSNVAIGINGMMSLSSLKNITMPNNIVQIRDRAFNNTKSLAFVVMPNKYIAPNECFRYCSKLSKAIYAKEQTITGSNLFEDCVSLTNVILSGGFTTIGSSTFKRCFNLVNIKMPNTITSITGNFEGCDSLTKIDFTSHTSIPTLAFQGLEGIPTDCKIVVPDNLYNSWKTTQNWSYYASNIISESDYNAS